ncbi:DNA mismatch repair endonuclease MutL [Alginatibacterium sediminis]|uniref:DNA mismatch repair endonuclease MutL n=1 Tax=Alginatibacterium sediminis TaxID=2164068 RepID=UPI00131420E1|nr:DNA mismatch repair endonuclease MutL [Alginatibacterium sediminis]
MLIQTLSPQLANQIAAGEVVERPSSVVKELVENSLDAGATKIELELDKGGCKRILVRDNGRGVSKDQLSLALSRHATSKLQDFDQLCQIATLGFRGEALASISSVARLSFSSRPLEQEQAWQARARGRDMAVEISPCAHPFGSSVEVMDLFYNTPARRKFLRAEKTEFSHIDELMKRIVLSRFDVAISIKHNGKVHRQYAIANTPEQRHQRVAKVFGQEFLTQSVYIENKHDQLRLHGWLGHPSLLKNNSDQQYFYVNGRVVRDRLIQHALRQSYQPYINYEGHPCFALFLDLPFDQVDVNVHPAKHEVRFHQNRLVHDYIERVLASALEQSVPKTAQYSSQDQIESKQANDSQGEYLKAPNVETKLADPKPYHHYEPQPTDSSSSNVDAKSSKNNTPSFVKGPEKPDPKRQAAYTDWLKQADQFQKDAASNLGESVDAEPLSSSQIWDSLTVVSETRFILSLRHQSLPKLVDWSKLWALSCVQSLSKREPERQALLLPLRISLESAALNSAQQFQQVLNDLGLCYQVQSKSYLAITHVPKVLRQLDMAQVTGHCLDYLSQQHGSISKVQIVAQLVDMQFAPRIVSPSQLQLWLSQNEQSLERHLPSCSIDIDLSATHLALDDRLRQAL